MIFTEKVKYLWYLLIFQKQDIFTLCGLCFTAFTALNISLVYLTVLSVALIQGSVHRERAEPYTNVLRQSFAISNMFIDGEEEKS